MPYRTTPKMAARKDARRQALLDAATRLFGQYGYHATTVPMIVATAKSSTGSFYMHFRNKEAVFEAALEALGARIADVIDRAKAAERDPVEQIRGAVISLFSFLARRPREARLLIVESSGLSPRLEQVRRDLLARHAGAVRHTLESHPERFPGSEPAVAARCLVGAVFESLCSWLEAGARKRPPAGQLARSVAEYNVRALRG